MKHTVKRCLKWSAGAVARATGLLSRAHFGQVLVLAYHRVLPVGDPEIGAVEPGMYVTDETLRMHLRFLRREYDVISLADWIASWSGEPLPRRSRYCLLTFDDGWADNYEFAFPLLKADRVPATIFLPTAFIDTTKWFWTDALAWLLARGDLARLRGPAPPEAPEPWSIIQAYAAAAHRPGASDAISGLIETLKRFSPGVLDRLCTDIARRLDMMLPAKAPCMTWMQVHEMAAAGIRFGSHAHTHSLLNQLSTGEVRSELEISRQTLAAAGVESLPALTYPNGSFDSGVQALAETAGYQTALTMRAGVEARIPRDRFAVPRIPIHEDVSNSPELLTWRLLAATGWGRTAPAAPHVPVNPSTSPHLAREH